MFPYEGIFSTQTPPLNFPKPLADLPNLEMFHGKNLKNSGSMEWRKYRSFWRNKFTLGKVFFYCHDIFFVYMYVYMYMYMYTHTYVYMHMWTYMYYIYTYKYLQSSLFIIPNPPQEPLHKYHVPVFVRSGHCLVQRWRARRSTGAMATDPYTIVCYGQPAKGHLDQPRILSKTNQSLEHVFFFNRKTMENSESQQEISISKIRNPLHAWEASTIFVPFTIQ